MPMIKLSLILHYITTVYCVPDTFIVPHICDVTFTKCKPECLLRNMDFQTQKEVILKVDFNVTANATLTIMIYR